MVQWGSVTPFVLKSADQFRFPEPPAVNSPRALADLEEVNLEEVKAIGGSKSATRTAEQSEIGRYWYESSPQGWNRIAREVLAARQFDVWERRRRQRMAELPSDLAGTGLPLDPYGGRGCCGYDDGPVLQHRLHQFLDDQRRTLSGHHPQVLELLGSSA